MNICNHPEQKVLSKLNFFRFMGRFQKMQKKIFLTPQVNIIHQNHILLSSNYHTGKFSSF